MDFNSFQETASEFAKYPNRGFNLQYVTLGLCGEAGEVAEKVKKLYRDGGGVVTFEFRMAVKKELGDLLWYLSQVAAELEIPLEDVAEANLAKLAGRLARGTIHGSGDDR